MSAIGKGKKVRTGIYRDGGPTLFVPGLVIWEAREKLGKAQRAGAPSEMRALVRATAGAVHARTVEYYLNLYDGEDWFRPWFLESRTAPASVHVVSRRDVEHATAAWRYSALIKRCGRAGTNGYIRWFQEQVFPVEQVADFVGWLYGGPDPRGWLMLPEWAVELRNELAPAAICRAGDVAMPTYKRWKNDGGAWAAVQEAIEAVRQGRHCPPLEGAWGKHFGDACGWSDPKAVGEAKVREIQRQLKSGYPVAAVADSVGVAFSVVERIKNDRYHLAKVPGSREKTKLAMVRYAKAATETAALGRVQKTLKLKSPPRLSDLRSAARGVNCLDALNDFISGKLCPTPHTDVARRRWWAQRGILAPGLFLPYTLMRKFREFASKAAAENHIATLARATPCFEKWMLDWVLPIRMSGRESPYRDRVGLVTVATKSPIRNAGAHTNTAPLRSAYSAEAIAAAKCKCRSQPMAALVEAVADLHVEKGDDFFPGKWIAKKAGREPNSWFRTGLSKMVDLEILAIGPGGRSYGLRPIE